MCSCGTNYWTRFYGPGHQAQYSARNSCALAVIILSLYTNLAVNILPLPSGTMLDVTGIHSAGYATSSHIYADHLRRLQHGGGGLARSVAHSWLCRDEKPSQRLSSETYSARPLNDIAHLPNLLQVPVTVLKQ